MNLETGSLRLPRRHSKTIAIGRAVLSLCVVAAVFAIGACGHVGRAQRPVSIDSRPTPPQPSSSGESGTTTVATEHTAAPQTSKTPETAIKRIEADTLATHKMLARCTRGQLLPDQESTVDSARQLLADTHVALEHGDLVRAASLARQARQLSSSLSCPP